MVFGLEADPFWIEKIGTTNKDPVDYFEGKFDTVAKKCEAAKRSSAALAAKKEKFALGTKPHNNHPNLPDYRKNPTGRKFLESEKFV